MNKKIINTTLIIFIALFLTTITYAYTVEMNFWRESRLQQSPHHDDGTQYIPSASQFIQNGCGTGTVLDKKHGLCWDGNGNRFGTSNWTQANDVDCAGLTLGGRTDWRLPTINELLTLVRDEGTNSGTYLNGLGVGFSSYQNSWYWTGDIRASDTSHAWVVTLDDGRVTHSAVTNLGRVVCVARY